MYFAEIGTIAFIVLLACISPGPDFIAVTSSAVTGRKAGILVALGVSVACTIWAGLAVFGLGFVLGQLAWLYEVLRFVGAAYLLWLGVKMLLSARHSQETPNIAVREKNSKLDFQKGLLIGVTNPKSAAFFGSLFVTVLPVEIPLWVQLSTVGVVFLVALFWFICLAFLFSIQKVRDAYCFARRPVDALMGVVLMGLSARLMLLR